MSIYIKGIEMPKTYPLTVTIYPDGRVLSETVGAKDIHGHAVPVSSHGNLKDADAIRKNWLENYRYALTRSILDSFDDAPTIISAEEESA